MTGGKFKRDDENEGDARERTVADEDTAAAAGTGEVGERRRPSGFDEVGGSTLNGDDFGDGERERNGDGDETRLDAAATDDRTRSHHDVPYEHHTIVIATLVQIDGGGEGGSEGSFHDEEEVGGNVVSQVLESTVPLPDGGGATGGGRDGSERGMGLVDSEVVVEVVPHFEDSELAQNSCRDRGRRVRLGWKAVATALLVGMAIALSVALRMRASSQSSSSSRPSPPRSGPSPSPPPSSRLESILKLASTVSNSETLVEGSQSPQRKAAEWLANDDGLRLALLPEIFSERIIQRYIVAVLYFSTGGTTSWRRQLNFLSESHECDWSEKLEVEERGGGSRVIDMGVSLCDGWYTLVSEITISGNNLTGTIPPELGALSMLTFLNLGWNENIRGRIPPALGSTTRLEYLRLEGCDLSGEIPAAELVNLSQLEDAAFYGNRRLTGNLDDMCPLRSKNLRQLQAECGGEEPQVECQCCTHCCNINRGECCVTNEPRVCFSMEPLSSGKG
uniref:Uncharacterized protein n=1 Tax=Odontella aurita TaxID=265563 RepID=A0A7S4IL01_9STRA